MGGILQKNERVLLVSSAKRRAARAAQRVVAAGGEAIIITTLAAARAITGAFDRRIFAFDLPDGSGIVLAAQMMLDARMSQIEFFHASDELVARDDHPSEVRSAAGKLGSERIAQHVA
jgi:hypothetical protein